MGYTALYRRWRPKIFEEVVGQSHITITLKNQIKNDNVAHAYLFCGTRGTGKTSTAKIFARAINCMNSKDFNPCNECDICRGILDENIMDVIEIDAASNNGVDNIRELRENIKYPPSKARYKVYIIDEVHMLSQGAFNALLKTLEEPPSYAVFILATTEPHKIPATILSRCQRYDFKRVTYEEIFNLLKKICTSMGIEAEDSALRLIVRNSDGAVRDAQSILDQCISFCDEKLTYEKAIETLGFVTDEFLFKLTDEIYNRNSERCMELIDDLVNSGKDIGHFIKDFINHFRNIMMTKMTKRPEEVINMSKEGILRLKEQSNKLDTNTIIRFINILSQGENEIKWSSQPRILLELIIIKLLQPQLDESYEGLLDRITQLEGKIEDFYKKGIPLREEKNSIQDNSEDKQHNIKNKQHSIENKKENKTIEIKENKREANLQNLNFQEIKNKWGDILKEIKRKKVSIHAVLMEGELIGFDGNKLIISFKEGFWFHKETTSKENNSEMIEKCIFALTEQNVKIKCVMEDELGELKGIKGIEDEMAISLDDSNSTDKEVEQVKEFFSEFQDKLEIIE